MTPAPADVVGRVEMLPPTPFQPLPDVFVIAFGYKARRGKDLAARVIQEAFEPGKIQRFGFADALKAVCRVQWGMTRKDAPQLQKVGCALRSIDEDIWTRALYWTLHEQRPSVALITDLRFPNDVDMIKAMGGYVVRIDRLDADGLPFQVTDRDPRHESETALDDFHAWDAVIENREGRQDLFRDAVLNTFMSHRERRPRMSRADASRGHKPHTVKHLHCFAFSSKIVIPGAEST